MQTPYLPQAIFGQDFKNVYEPAEDTFLLLDALESDLDSLKEKGLDVCLECGSGSGTIITALSMALNERNQLKGGGKIPTQVQSSTHNLSRSLMLATDINMSACKTTNKCVDFHKQNSFVDVIRTNMADALVDRLENVVDLLIFNPPYVPTEKDEYIFSHSKQIEKAWSGGYCGRELIDRFLRFYVPKLLSKPNGSAYMIALDQNNIPQLQDYLIKEHNIIGELVLQRRAGTELLHVIKYTWAN